MQCCPTFIQDITGERADELMELCAPKGNEPEGYQPLFRLEGSGARRKLAVVKTRGNEHHLEKVRPTPVSGHGNGAPKVGAQRSPPAGASSRRAYCWIARWLFDGCGLKTCKLFEQSSRWHDVAKLLFRPR